MSASMILCENWDVNKIKNWDVICYHDFGEYVQLLIIHNDEM